MDVLYHGIVWLGHFIPLLMLAIAFYVLVSKPLQKQYQIVHELRTNLVPGSVIQTRDGLRGTIREVFARSVLVDLVDGVKAEVLKQSIVSVTSHREK